VFDIEIERERSDRQPHQSQLPLGAHVPGFGLSAGKGGFRRCGPGYLWPTSALVGFLIAGFSAQGLKTARSGSPKGPFNEADCAAEAV